MSKFINMLGTRIGLVLLLGSIAVFNVCGYIDRGRIDEIVAAGKPLYMNESAAQITMVFSVFAGIIGVLTLIGAFIHYVDVHHAEPQQ
ncbi:MAG: hypothetical protein AAB618_02380 [Patescibacteria group bacterium]